MYLYIFLLRIRDNIDLSSWDTLHKSFLRMLKGKRPLVNLGRRDPLIPEGLKRNRLRGYWLDSNRSHRVKRRGFANNYELLSSMNFRGISWISKWLLIFWSLYI
jgi:hypothetical protein